jgi:membrane protein DedA with SNARE-associated domain
MQDSLFNWIAQHGSVALFGLLTFGIVGLPVPDETLLIIAGVLIRQARLGVVATYVAALAGASFGITISYLIGRAAGVAVIRRYGPRLRIVHEDVDAVRALFHRSGKWTLMFGYFIPGVRHFTALVAGGAELEYPLFGLFAYAGALLWTTSFITLGIYVGDRWQPLANELEYHGRWVGALAGAGVVAAIMLYRFRHRLRR